MSTPAGWYDDGHGTQRWWDGSAWTEHTAPAPAAPEQSAVPDITAEAPSSGSGNAAPPAAPDDPASGYSAPAAPEHFTAGQAYPPVPEAPASAGYPPAPGYPSAPVAPGYAPSPEQPKKSKLWILWVVLGGVLVLLIVGAVLLVPAIIGLFTTATGGAAGGTSDDERAAVDVVLSYDDAFDDADCELYEQSTTQAFRESGGYPDCASFESGAETFDDNTEDYEVEITGVTTDADGAITVTTTETYLSYVDGEGNQLGSPEQVADPFVYTLVDDGGRWAIDGIQ